MARAHAARIIGAGNVMRVTVASWTARRGALTNVILAALVAGFLYAGRATAVRYYEIFREPAAGQPSASIDIHLEPAGLAGADDLRRAVAEAGWGPGEDILVLAASSAITRQDLYQLYYSTGYLLYPSRAWLAAWCDPEASATQCETLDAERPQSAVARYRVRRVLLVGGGNPFPGSDSRRLSDRIILVTLP